MTEAALIRELRQLHERVGTIDAKLDKVRAEDLPIIRADVAALNIKAGIWGFAAGAIPTLLAVALLLLRGKL